MLTVFRRALVPCTEADADRGSGNAVVGAGAAGGGSWVVEGVRSPLLGVAISDLPGVEGGWIPDDFRVLVTGSAGRATLGGALRFRCGLGSAVVILKLVCYPTVAWCQFRPPLEEGKRRLKLESAADQL
jgi:hypothetical protein